MEGVRENRFRFAVCRDSELEGGDGVMTCNGVAVLVANLVTQLPELIRVAAVKALA